MSTVRISDRAHATLEKLARESRQPMQRVLDEAIEAYRREKLLDAIAEGFDRLAEDPAAWDEYRKELQVWDATLMDGLPRDEVWVYPDLHPSEDANAD